MTTWKEIITNSLEENKESWKDIVYISIPVFGSFEEAVCNKFGAPEGSNFQMWTSKRVYFPLWCGSMIVLIWAYRDPCNKALEHQGNSGPQWHNKHEIS